MTILFKMNSNGNTGPLIKFTFIFIISVLLSFCVGAQRDTTKRQVVDITSSYKPVLRNISKLNLSASQLQTDTSKLKMSYNVPAQNLFYSYQPVSLRPLAYDQDSLAGLTGNNFVKIGIGNYTTPFVSAGLNFGDGKTTLANLYADYISSKGKIQYQDYSVLNIKAAGSYFKGSNEIYGGITVNRSDYYLYGYDHALFTYSKSELLQRFSNFSVNGGVRNTVENELGIDYNPSLKISFFNLKDRVGENSIAFDLPAEKMINDRIKAKIDLSLNYTAYTTKGYIPDNFKIKNTVIQISPEVVYSDPMFVIHGGIIPVLDNKKIAVLPNIYSEAKIKDKSFTAQAGLVGKVIINTFGNLSKVNPYIQTVFTQNNTRETELYGGIKSAFGKHFNFTAKVGLVHFKNFQFFVNDTSDFKSFKVTNDPDVDDLRIHADISYVNKEKFSFTAGLTFNGYTGMKFVKYAWGTVPLEINAALRWKASDKLKFRSDLYAFGGGPYLLKGNVTKDIKGGFDLSAGTEYTINKKWSAWMDINNMFNSKYQRWYSYPVYGINVLAGVKYIF